MRGRYKSVLLGHQTALYEGNVDFLKFDPEFMSECWDESDCTLE